MSPLTCLENLDESLDESLSDVARRIRELSIEQWGERDAVVLVGRDEALLSAQHKLLQFARANSPVLLTGETGTGKELFARALFLLSGHRQQPFIAVNCAQYGDGNLLASELFGHRRGSFTGAVSDHRGLFEEANGGLLFLDEVGELSPLAQSMLLRAISEGEIVPVGDTRVRRVRVQLIAATSRDLSALAGQGLFRSDLLFRLRILQIQVPALRTRGRDWELLARYYLAMWARHTGLFRALSDQTHALLSNYSWPGNIRELRAIIETGCLLTEATLIEPDHVIDHLVAERWSTGRGEPTNSPAGNANVDPAAERLLDLAAKGSVWRSGDGHNHGSYLLAEITAGRLGFWEDIHDPFMERDLNRDQVKQFISSGLRSAAGSYKRLLAALNMPASDYLRFMDFLRHHRLKPSRWSDAEPAPPLQHAASSRQ